MFRSSVPTTQTRSRGPETINVCPGVTVGKGAADRQMQLLRHIAFASQQGLVPAEQVTHASANRVIAFPLQPGLIPECR